MAAQASQVITASHQVKLGVPGHIIIQQRAQCMQAKAMNRTAIETWMV